MSMGDRTPPAHVVVFSELTPRARVQYTRFLVDQRVTFVRRASDGRFVANVRLVKQRSASPALELAETVEPQEPMPTAAIEEPLSSCVPPTLQRFASLVRLLESKPPKALGSMCTKESRLVRMMNDIYDARFEVLASGAASIWTTSAITDGSSFAAFVRHYLTNRFGLKKLVEQQAWELLEGLTHLQQQVDVELFSSFLEGKYAEPTLLFFLSARMALQRLVSGALYRPSATRPSSTKRKSAASCLLTPVWLSQTQLDALVPMLFGSKHEDVSLQFTHTIRAFLASDEAVGRSFARLLEAQEVLLMAVETHHKAVGTPTKRVAQETPESSGISGSSGWTCSHATADPIKPTAVRSASLSATVVAQRPPNEDAASVQQRVEGLLERMKQRQQQHITK